MSTTNEILEKFRSDMKGIANQLIDESIIDYIPYAEDDKINNVYFIVNEWLNAFFSDTLTDEQQNNPCLVSHDGKLARQLLIKRHKKELQNLIIQDQAERIKYLERLNHE